jgi:hypothetical protein
MSSSFKQTPHYKYIGLAKKISEVLFQVDPMNIADITDEYDPEANDIARMAVIQQEKITAKMVKEVFDRWFGPLRISNEACNEIIRRLKKVAEEYVG